MRLDSSALSTQLVWGYLTKIIPIKIPITNTMINTSSPLFNTSILIIVIVAAIQNSFVSDQCKLKQAIWNESEFMVMNWYTPIHRNYSHGLFDYCLYLLRNCLDDTLINYAGSPHTPHLVL